MLQNLVDFLPHIWTAALLLGGLMIGLSQNSASTHLDPESLRLNRRRVKGGAIFNDLLWEQKGEEERRMRKFLDRMADPDTGDADRRLYAEQIATSQRQLDRIYQCLTMKDPDHD